MRENRHTDKHKEKPTTFFTNKHQCKKARVANSSKAETGTDRTREYEKTKNIISGTEK